MSATQQILKDFPQVSIEKWQELFLKETKQEQFQAHHSYLGFDFLPFYTQQNDYTAQAKLLQQLSTGHAERWYISRHIQMKDAEVTNQKILAALNKGVSSITLSGDLKDEKQADLLLKEVMANYIEINFSSSHSTHTAEQYFNWCERNNISRDQIFGAIYADPLAEALKNGGWKNGKEQDLDQLAAHLQTVSSNSIQLKAILVDASIYHYAGASLVQTIAYTLAHALEYLNEMQAKGIKPDAVIDRMVFKWPVGTSFFGEMAALRAFRLLWNNLCRHLTGQHQKNYSACIHAETSVHTWSVADMYNNLLRATTQCMTAISGGASSVHVFPYNGVSTDANDFSERMSANIQLLLREESFMGKVADPAAGSYLVEALTHQLAEKALTCLKETEAKGGLLELMKKGELQHELSQNMMQMRKAVKEGEIKVLGANLYPNKNEDLSVIPSKNLFSGSPEGKDFAPLKMQRLADVLEHH